MLGETRAFASSQGPRCAVVRRTINDASQLAAALSAEISHHRVGQREAL